jgi:hypothetical protein
LAEAVEPPGVGGFEAPFGFGAAFWIDFGWILGTGLGATCFGTEIFSGLGGLACVGCFSERCRGVAVSGATFLALRLVGVVSIGLAGAPSLRFDLP